MNSKQRRKARRSRVRRFEAVEFRPPVFNPTDATNLLRTLGPGLMRFEESRHLGFKTDDGRTIDIAQANGKTYVSPRLYAELLEKFGVP